MAQISNPESTPVLFDTSVWVIFINKPQTITPDAKKQVDLLRTYIDEDYPVRTCPVIIQELLQGIREDKHYHVFSQTLLAFDMIAGDWLQRSLEAAAMYRTLRKKGITIRKPNDCLIAAVALHYQVYISHNDSDFDQIARIFPLRLVK